MTTRRLQFRPFAYSAKLVLLLGVLVLLPGASAQNTNTAAYGATLVSKTTIVGNVVHYYWLLTTSSPAPFNQVGVHRVVEQNGNAPIRSTLPVFLAHGSFGTFNDDFMDGTTSLGSMPVYLAQQGIDVWGIDFGWSLVPKSQTDFSFMKTWGLQRDINDLEQAIAFARGVRASTGSDGGPLALLGYSLSETTGYALLNEETQLPYPQRNVKAYIPVDNFIATNDSNVRAGSCYVEGSYTDSFNKGIYADNTGVIAERAGTYAQNDPNGVSPFFPQYTNLQLVLVQGAATWQLGAITPKYGHYVAGLFGPDGIKSIPTGFHYTDLSRYETVLASTSPYVPNELWVEFYAIICGNANPNFSDHLGQITVPVFYLGAAGGEGNLGLYQQTLLGSNDVQDYIVSFYPPDQYALDYGHNDLFLAYNAQDVVWSRILVWLIHH